MNKNTKLEFFDKIKIARTKIIFFDLDDTLYFRQDAFVIACKKFFNIFTVELAKRIAECCRKRGDEVFYQSQRGQISMQEMYIYRFKKGFDDCKIAITEKQALEFEEVYRKELYSLKINSNVKNVLKIARQHFDKIGIITNGPKEHQWNKIKNLGLLDYIDKEFVIVSGEVGFDKPDLKVFKIAENCANKICGQQNDFFIVGDSLCNDIIPAKKLGWKTIWINLYNEQIVEQQSQFVDFKIKSIEEIISIFAEQKNDGLN